MKKENQIVIGHHPVFEAIRAGKEINRILIKSGIKNQQFTELFRLIRQNNIPFQYVPVEKLNKFGTNHQGVIAFLSLIEYKNLAEIVQRTFEAGRDPFIIVLDHITDVRNFGAIARTAECAGVNAIVVPTKGSVSITPDAIKASSGALNRLAVCRTSDISNTIKFLQESGLKVVAATEKAEKYYYAADLKGPITLLMGSEEKGVSKEILKMTVSKIKIPMEGSIESLNVSVACGILAFEIVRQRGIKE